MGKLPTDLARGECGEIRMVVGVVADIAALRPYLCGFCRVFGLAEAELEECRGRMSRPQNVEDGWGVRARSIVEGQVHDAALLRVLARAVWRWKRRVLSLFKTWLRLCGA
jgi:hypothetical protein